jgi:hypothetical protein
MVGTTFCLFILLTDRGLKSDLANDTDRLLGSVRHFLEECELSPDSVEKPKTRRSLGETFISYNSKHEKTTTNTPKQNRSLRQRR